MFKNLYFLVGNVISVTLIRPLSLAIHLNLGTYLFTKKNVGNQKIKVFVSVSNDQPEGNPPSNPGTLQGTMLSFSMGSPES